MSLAARRGAGAVDSDRQVLHVLNRLAFGPTARRLRLCQDGRGRALHRRATRSREYPRAVRAAPSLGPAQHAGPRRGRAAAVLRPAAPGERASSRPSRRSRRNSSGRRWSSGKRRRRAILRAVLSRRQLEQVMVNFWFNHFNIFAGEGLERIWIGNYEERAIRPYALGRFRDLLFAVAKHPAMLVYLDNTQNTALAAQRRGDRLEREFRARGHGAAHPRRRWRIYPGRRRDPGARLYRVADQSADSQRVSRRRRGLRRHAPRLRPKVFLGRKLRRARPGRGRGGARYSGVEPGHRAAYRL